MSLHDSTMTEASSFKAKLARALGYAGALPFIALCIHTWMWPEYRAFGARALVGYAAVIVTFLGAIYWGVALTLNSENQSSALDSRLNVTLALVWSIIPSLLAWAGLMLPAQLGRYWMLIILIVCLGVDLLLARRFLLPGWYRNLRIVLTSIAAAALLIARMVPGPAI